MIGMLRYHLFLAWKSIRRTPGNSLIVLAGIALGVAVATLFSAIYYTYARDPIPEKSKVLYYVRMDNWDPERAHADSGGVPPLMSYRDMIGIMKSTIPLRQTGTFEAYLWIAAGKEPARQEEARICHGDFFAMFQLPFRYGSGWTREQDENADPVVVLDDLLNQRFFRGENSVGRTVRVEDRDFRVVGVLAPFRPALKYYGFTSRNLTLPPERMFLSMSHVVPMKIGSIGAALQWGPQKKKGFEGALEAERNFLEMWVELPGPSDVAAYHAFLDAYALDQRRIGRFQRPLDNRVTPLREFMRERELPPPAATAMMITANLFLTACALSLMGLLLSRFLARSAEIGVRRALGAKRLDIFLQHIVECEMIALVGGLLGLALATICLGLVNGWVKAHSVANRDDIYRMNPTMAVFAVAVSLFAGLLAGVFPAVRACRIAPASHLKIQ